MDSSDGRAHRGHAPAKKGLDLTSRLYANSLHSGALTEKGPSVPWAPPSMPSGSAHAGLDGSQHNVGSRAAANHTATVSSATLYRRARRNDVLRIILCGCHRWGLPTCASAFEVSSRLRGESNLVELRCDSHLPPTTNYPEQFAGQSVPVSEAIRHFHRNINRANSVCFYVSQRQQFC